MDFDSKTRAAENRTRCLEIVAKSSVVPQRPCKARLWYRINKNVIARMDFDSRTRAAENRTRCPEIVAKSPVVPPATLQGHVLE